MRSTKIAITLVCILFIGTVFSQENKTFDSTVTSQSFQAFFLRNPSVDSLHFTMNGLGRKYLWVYSKDSLANKKTIGFASDFAGDVYRFNKKYGQLLLPELAMQRMMLHSCNLFYYIDGRSSSESVQLQLNYECPPPAKTKKPDSEKDDEEDWDKTFTKTDIGVSIKGGAKVLSQSLTAAIRHKGFSKTEIGDSVLFFHAIVSPKDSVLQDVKLVEEERSGFADTVQQVLTKTLGWLPSHACGRPVKSYVTLFIQLREDGSVLIDWTGK